MVDLIHGSFQRGYRFRLAPHQSILKHDDIQSDPQNTVSLNDELNLFVTKLTLPIAYSSRILMAGMDSSLKVFCNLPERDIREMRHVNGHA